MAFIATNVELERNDENPDRDLNRAEFFEILLRIANDKFKKPKLAETYAQALRKLIREHLLVYYDPVMTYQDWREKYLWTLEVEDIFKINAAALQRLYKTSQQQSSLKRFWTMKDCINMVSFCSELGISENQVKMAYTYSKITVINEDSDNLDYNKMTYIEFLEFIGRLAYLVKIPEDIEAQLL